MPVIDIPDAIDDIKTFKLNIKSLTLQEADNLAKELCTLDNLVNFVARDVESDVDQAIPKEVDAAVVLAIDTITRFKKESPLLYPHTTKLVSLILSISLELHNSDKDIPTKSLLRALHILLSHEDAATLPDRVGMLYQYSIFFVSIALSQSTTAADINRLMNHLSYLKDVDFADSSSGPILVQLTRSAESQNFLKFENDTHFLSFLISDIDIIVTTTLLNKIKERVATVNQSSPVIYIYKGVIARAWKESTGIINEYIEAFIGEFIEHAMLCELNMAKKCQTLLSDIMSALHDTQLLKLKNRIFDPPIVEKVTASNYKVRRNAITMLGAAFPLADPDDSAKNYNKKVTTHYNMISRGIKDGHPYVRVAAIQSLVRVLARFWEVFPLDTSSDGLLALVTQSLVDSVPLVRASALEGLAVLTKNPVTHEILKEALPTMKHIVNDKSVMVRQAMLDLLEVVCTARTINQSVVPSDILLPRVIKEDMSINTYLLQDGIEYGTASYRSLQSLTFHAPLNSEGFTFMDENNSLPSVKRLCQLKSMLCKYIYKDLYDDIDEINSVQKLYNPLKEFLYLSPLACLTFLKDTSLPLTVDKSVKLLISFVQKAYHESKQAYMVSLDYEALKLENDSSKKQELTEAEMGLKHHVYACSLIWEVNIVLADKLRHLIGANKDPLSEKSKDTICKVILVEEKLGQYISSERLMLSKLRSYVLRFLLSLNTTIIDIYSERYTPDILVPSIVQFIRNELEVYFNKDETELDNDIILLFSGILPLAYRWNILDQFQTVKDCCNVVKACMSESAKLKDGYLLAVRVLKIYLEFPVMNRELKKNNLEDVRKMVLHGVENINKHLITVLSLKSHHGKSYYIYEILLSSAIAILDCAGDSPMRGRRKKTAAPKIEPIQAHQLEELLISLHSTICSQYQDMDMYSRFITKDIELPWDKLIAMNLAEALNVNKIIIALSQFSVALSAISPNIAVHECMADLVKISFASVGIVKGITVTNPMYNDRTAIYIKSIYVGTYLDLWMFWSKCLSTFMSQPNLSQDLVLRIFDTLIKHTDGSVSYRQLQAIVALCVDKWGTTDKVTSLLRNYTDDDSELNPATIENLKTITNNIATVIEDKSQQESQASLGDLPCDLPYEAVSPVVD